MEQRRSAALLLNKLIRKTFLFTFRFVQAAVLSAVASTLVVFNTTVPPQNVSLLVFPLLSHRDIWYSSCLKLWGMAGERKLSPS